MNKGHKLGDHTDRSYRKLVHVNVNPK